MKPKRKKNIRFILPTREVSLLIKSAGKRMWIILNNYDDGVGIEDRPTVRAKVQYAVEVQVDSNEVEKVSDDRDVYLYSGDLDLNKHEHKIQKKH